MLHQRTHTYETKFYVSITLHTETQDKKKKLTEKQHFELQHQICGISNNTLKSDMTLKSPFPTITACERILRKYLHQFMFSV